MGSSSAHNVEHSAEAPCLGGSVLGTASAAGDERAAAAAGDERPTAPARPTAAGVVRLAAPAKVNLHLGISTQLDERGYHLADSVMVALGLHDVVTVAPAEALSVTCEPDAGCPEQSNTCWKGAVALGEAFGFEPRYDIRVERHVPNQAGLGGASSDAAAAIAGICLLRGIDPKDSRVADVARRVGADVPFFLVGSPCHLDGAGDEAREAFAPLRRADGSPVPVALVRPEGDGVSTPAAYREFDREPIPAAPLAPMLDALRAGDAERACAAVSNNLGPVACRLLPKVNETLAWLRAQDGVTAAQVSGSGSSCFAICESAAAADAVAAGARGRDLWSFSTEIADGGVRVLPDDALLDETLQDDKNL